MKRCLLEPYRTSLVFPHLPAPNFSAGSDYIAQHKNNRYGRPVECFFAARINLLFAKGPSAAARRWVGILVPLAFACIAVAADNDAQKTESVPPKSPQESLASMQTSGDFQIELV